LSGSSSFGAKLVGTTLGGARTTWRKGEAQALDSLDHSIEFAIRQFLGLTDLSPLFALALQLPRDGTELLRDLFLDDGNFHLRRRPDDTTLPGATESTQPVPALLDSASLRIGFHDLSDSDSLRDVAKKTLTAYPTSAKFPAGAENLA
jgi:hypothetical protein